MVYRLFVSFSSFLCCLVHSGGCKPIAQACDDVTPAKDSLKVLCYGHITEIERENCYSLYRLRKLFKSRVRPCLCTRRMVAITYNVKNYISLKRGVYGPDCTYKLQK